MTISYQRLDNILHAVYMKRWWKCCWTLSNKVWFSCFFVMEL